MKKNIGNILQELMDRHAGRSDDHESPYLTSFGVPLSQVKPHHYQIDLSELRIFAGLSTLVSHLTHDVVEQCSFGVADIMVRKRVEPNTLKELVDMGVLWITIYARLEAAESLPFFQNQFRNCLHIVFNAIQTPRWGKVLFPELFLSRQEMADDGIPALVFPFHLKAQQNKAGYFILLERCRTGHFLRITVEDAGQSRLQLKHIPHRVVDNLSGGTRLAGHHNMAGEIIQGILRECTNNWTEYKEIAERQPALFEHLKKEGLPNVSLIHFRWTPANYRFFLPAKTDALSPPADYALSILNKVLLLMTDPDILRHLAGKEVIEMRSGIHRIFLDTSRRGTCLNVCFDEKRPRPALHHYLAPMQHLEALCRTGKNPFKGMRLFLIHHITAEVLGLIEGFRSLGCEEMTTTFVRYAGVVPDEYLEAIGAMPDDRMRFHSLQKIEWKDSLRETYILSNQYSDPAGLSVIDEYLSAEKPDFFAAMRFLAGHLFFREAVLNHHRQCPLLLVEDGGYLSPLINRFCIENKTVGEVLKHFFVTKASLPEETTLDDKELLLPLATWMNRFFIGAVEHTKNGYDNNQEVLQQWGRLQFPVASIAISNLKRGPEAQACSSVILNAIENILHRLGLLLTHRHVLVMGGSGAIGRCLVCDLYGRLGPNLVYGVDIASPQATPPVMNFRFLDEIPSEILYKIDLFIGVIGQSILQPYILEDILDRGGQKDIFFVSGSTKTVEFADLEKWLQNLKDSPEPQIAGKTVLIRTHLLRDLQTGILQGHCLSIRFADDSLPEKNLYLLGGLTPINFLYYGIPRELMDQVMVQLMRVCVGMACRYKDSRPLPPRLLAVDRDIDENTDFIPI
ncbi:MAG TPA: hypothetical protein PLC82_07055 [Smithellaceae bacterium]|nr:hypothetical protein [Smithellaceae bacterium]